MYKFFFSILFLLFSHSSYSNDSLKHNQLFCPDYFFEIYNESVEIIAFEFLNEDKVNIYWGNYTSQFFNKNLFTIKGTYSKNLNYIYIKASDSVQQDFSDSEFIINRKNLKLKFSIFQEFESTKECNVIKEADLKNYVKSYFEQEIQKIENKVKSENKI